MYWKKCYESIRIYYPENRILIIDDNSNYNILDIKYQENLYKTIIFKNKDEFKGRGELLPYCYYLNYKFCHKVVIIHDSVFINSYIDFNNTDKYTILWDFLHNWDDDYNAIQLIKQLNNSYELLDFYLKKNLWTGCFGAMSIISHDYLVELNNKYNISNLLHFIKNRYDRQMFERIIACMLIKNHPKKCLLGNIHNYCPWGISYYDINNFSYLPIIKVWTGR